MFFVDFLQKLSSLSVAQFQGGKKSKIIAKPAPNPNVSESITNTVKWFD